MKKGPPSSEVGVASCPMCHGSFLVATNKHGYPAGYCAHCKTQIQPRDQRGAQLLLGRIYEWRNLDAAGVMLDQSDVENMQPATAPQARKLPPHLKPATTKLSPAPASTAKVTPAIKATVAKPIPPKVVAPQPSVAPSPQKTSWWDREL